MIDIIQLRGETMVNVIWGVLGFLLFLLYDINSVTWKMKALHSSFAAGCILLVVGSTGLGYEALTAGGPAGIRDYILISLGVLNMFLLVYTLFFALPFKETYCSREDVGDGNYRVEEKSNVCDRGVYALCRHPGVLWFFFFFFFCGLGLHSSLFMTGGMIFSACNLGYVIFQDIWTFPKTFSDYEEYKKKTPFLIPDLRSIKACMASLAEGRGRR